MHKFIFFVILAFFIQGCCGTNHCTMQNFAQNAKVLFGGQINDSFRDAPKTARFFGNALKGDVNSFVKTGGYVVEVGKGDLKSTKTVARMIREQWDESVRNMPGNIKAIGKHTCLYCDAKK